jgi:hypothetical protein
MSLSVDTTLKVLLDDPAARDVLMKHFGDRTNDPRSADVLHQSLRSISYYPEAAISQEKLKQVDDDLRRLSQGRSDSLLSSSERI